MVKVEFVSVARYGIDGMIDDKTVISARTRDTDNIKMREIKWNKP